MGGGAAVGQPSLAGAGAARREERGGARGRWPARPCAQPRPPVPPASGMLWRRDSRCVAAASRSACGERSGRGAPGPGHRDPRARRPPGTETPGHRDPQALTPPDAETSGHGHPAHGNPHSARSQGNPCPKESFTAAPKTEQWGRGAADPPQAPTPQAPRKG